MATGARDAKVRLDRHIDALSEATTLAEAAAPLCEIGLAIGLARPAVVEDFTETSPSHGLDGGILGEIFGWRLPTSGEAGPHSLYRVCPIGRACRVAVSPFAWESSSLGAAEFSWDERISHFWRAAAERGVFGGITVPIHLPLSRVGAVGWLAIGPPVDLARLVRLYSNDLRLAAQLFMDHVHRERPETSATFQHARLTERELECLTWVALGKTDAEIGELIARSPSTARFHVDSAVEKLGVNNRTRAAAVASQLGMIRAVA